MTDLIYQYNVDQVVDDIQRHVDQIKAEDNGIEADCQKYETSLVVSVKLPNGEERSRVFIMRNQLIEMRNYLQTVLVPLTTVSPVPSSEAQGTCDFGSAA
jgi:hypothetical protein